MTEILAKGIEFSQNESVYVLRVVAGDPKNHFKNRFVLGSIIEDGGDSPYTRSLTDDFVAALRSGAFNLKPSKELTLLPIWVSNGIFFNAKYLFTEGRRRAELQGAVVQNGSNYQSLRVKNQIANAASSLKKNAKERRWMFIQNLYPNGEVEWNFQHLRGDEEAYKIQQGTQGVPFPIPQKSPSGKTGWDWAMGGAGNLIEDGRSQASFGTARSQGSFPAEVVEGKAGLIIAQNYNEDDPDFNVLYLIMPRGNRGWDSMATYLLNSGPNGFLRQIGHPGDGIILQAIVFDGGSSRQAWVRGEESRLPLSSSETRQCPHYVCLWGEAPP